MGEDGTRRWWVKAWSPALVAVSVALLGPSTTASAQDYPVVYVRCPRTDEPIDYTGEVEIDGERRTVTRTMSGGDVYDDLPDVTHFFEGFNAPCDLVHREPSGAERILYDCSSVSTDAEGCAAMDPAVSFDGRTVAFTVFRGPLEPIRKTFRPEILDPDAENTEVTRVDFPTRTIAATEARLHLVDIASGDVTALPHPEGTFDTGPARSSGSET